MTNRSYLNFDISIERSGDIFRARVLQSCAGEGSFEFELPFSEFELENFILKMGHARRSTGRTIRGSDSPEMVAAKQFGGKLFAAVFQGDVYACLRASLDEAHSQGGGVRVLLRLAPELADIPWEYIYNPAWNQFFALSADTPLVRYLELTPPIFPLPVKPPLRLLAVIASPSEYPALDVESEWRNLQEALQPLVRQGLLVIERLESANLLALQRQLRHSEYHIFHFIGHGTFDENAQDGLLMFTDELGRGKPLSGQVLGTLLRDHHTLRLAVLNACEGARSGREDPFAGVAHSLVQMGLPAVIAMQFEISDSAAILFAQEFYTALADGYPVDAALADARKAIFASNDCEWGTPVLFSRVLDGRIFELTRPVTAPAAPETTKSETQPLKASRQKDELEANHLYEDGLSAFYLEDWGRASEYFQAALALQPDHSAAIEKLAHAQRQLELVQRYTQAQAQLAAQDWSGAVQSLEQLSADDPQYRDTEALLQMTRQRLRLAELYSDAARLSQAGQWQAVISIIEQMHQLDPACPDTDGLLPAAKNALAEAARQQKLSELYSQALQAMEAQDWRGACQRLEQLGRMQADYRDAARLLEKVKAEMARQATAAKQPAAARQPVEISQPTEETIRPAGEVTAVTRKLPRWLWWWVGGICGLLEKVKAEMARQAAAAKQPAAARQPVEISQPTEKAIRLAGEVTAVLRKLPRWLWWWVGGICGLIVLIGVAAWGIGEVSWWIEQVEWNAAKTQTAIVQVTIDQRRAASTQTAAALFALGPTPTPIVISDAQGVQMALIPAGTFQMGSQNGSDNEKPVHTVNLTEAFYMDIYEVTNEAYAECVTAGKCSAPAPSDSHRRSSYFGDLTYANYPVINVNWNQANEYCAWRGGSLPTEAQWEYAARGGWEGMDFPWGDDFPVCIPGVVNSANFDDYNLKCEGDTVLVGSYAPNRFGLYDMVGNVEEWVADWYEHDYYSTYQEGSWPDDPVGPEIGDNSYRVMRGNGWLSSDSYYLRVAYRDGDIETEVNYDLGFRCAAKQQAASTQTAVAQTQEAFVAKLASAFPPTAATPTLVDLWEAAETQTAVARLTPMPTPKYTAITDAKGVQMALIPAGTFQMGSESGRSDEKPVHTVHISKDFYIDIYEVTNAAYAACVSADMCSLPVRVNSVTRSKYYDTPTFANYPMIHVNWSQANAYCAWRGSLPSEAQWEYAARGGLESRKYSWGDVSPICTVGAVNGANSSNCGWGDTEPVGSYAPNGYGLFDIAGNVLEWVLDWYQGDYYSTYPEDGWPDDPINLADIGEYRVLRGGSWLSHTDVLRVAFRDAFKPAVGDKDIGFRCVAPASE